MKIISNRKTVGKRLADLRSIHGMNLEDFAKFVVLVLDLLENPEDRFEFKEIALEMFGIGRRAIAVTEMTFKEQDRKYHPLACIASNFVREIQKTTIHLETEYERRAI